MTKPSELLQQTFAFAPTRGQAELFALWDDFILDKNTLRKTFLLKGYAGTGKTTVVSALVKTLAKFDYKVMLLAPTGRAAKVISSYTQRKAFTIHKIIYRRAEEGSGKLAFERQINYYKRTVFIVDEASMINDEADFGHKGLLTDLVDYVFDEETTGNKLLLIGDTAQLPPVHQSVSPALEAEYLKLNFKLRVTEKMLTEVMRQHENSGILVNATRIRNQISQQQVKVKLNTRLYRDIYRMEGDKLEDGLRYAYKKFGIENTVVICRSNKSATQYNQYIRRQIHFSEAEVEAGDYLLIVRNNYTWLPADSQAGFLANGEFVEVMKVVRFEEQHGFRFATLLLRLVDYPEHPYFEAKVHLTTLHSFDAGLSQEDYKKLYEQVIEDYEDIPHPRDRAEAIRKDEYLNALQVKFAYALTCHKAQGGQWDIVFVDQGYLKEDMMNLDLMRWLYTATTRAVNELYLVNFNQMFYQEG